MSDKINKILPSIELNAEAIEGLLNKDFKAEKPKEQIDKIVENKASDGRTLSRKSIQNLRQFSKQVVSTESKIASASNLRHKTTQLRTKDDADFPPTVHHPDMIKSVLTRDEIPYFIERWNSYQEIYGEDFNHAADHDTLVELVMCYVDLYRIKKKKKTSVTKVFDPDLERINDSTHKRAQQLLDSLKARRRDRIESQERKEDNLIKLLYKLGEDSKKFHNTAIKTLETEIDEEEKFLADKRKRGLAI